MLNRAKRYVKQGKKTCLKIILCDPRPVYFRSPATGPSGDRSATALAASLMLVRQHPVSLSPLSLSTLCLRYTCAWKRYDPDATVTFPWVGLG